MTLYLKKNTQQQQQPFLLNQKGNVYVQKCADVKKNGKGWVGGNTFCHKIKISFFRRNKQTTVYTHIYTYEHP